MKKFLLLFLVFLSMSANASLPPYQGIIQDIFDNVDKEISYSPELFSYRDQLVKESIAETLANPQIKAMLVNKGVWGELGRIVAGAVVGEIVHRTAERILDRTPTPRQPERPEPPRNDRNDRNDGPGPRPDPCPSAG